MREREREREKESRQKDRERESGGLPWWVIILASPISTPVSHFKKRGRMKKKSPLYLSSPAPPLGGQR